MFQSNMICIDKMIKRFIKFKINYKMDEQHMINFCKFSNYSTQSSNKTSNTTTANNNNNNKMETEIKVNSKKKLALISAKMNFGQVLYYS